MTVHMVCAFLGHNGFIGLWEIEFDNTIRSFSFQVIDEVVSNAQ